LLQILILRSIYECKFKISLAEHSFIFVCIFIVQSSLENAMFYCRFLMLSLTIFYQWCDFECFDHPWWSTDPHSAPCNCNILQSWARRLTVRTNGMAVLFTLKSVSSSVNDYVMINISRMKHGDGFRVWCYDQLCQSCQDDRKWT